MKKQKMIIVFTLVLLFVSISGNIGYADVNTTSNLLVPFAQTFDLQDYGYYYDFDYYYYDFDYYYYDFDDDDYYLYDDFFDFENVNLEGDIESRKLYIQNLLFKLIPSDKLNRITEIKEESDGLFGVLAYVEPFDMEGKKWILTYDPRDLNSKSELGKKEIIRTIIHEYAHIESLNETQVRHGDINKKSGELLVEEGVLNRDSYLTLFAKKFWTEEMMEKTAIESEKVALELFNKYPNQFINDYAATNFVEDFAESFAEFVLKDKIEDNKISSQKIKFFYNFKEFIELRDYMRKGIK